MALQPKIFQFEAAKAVQEFCESLFTSGGITKQKIETSFSTVSARYGGEDTYRFSSMGGGNDTVHPLDRIPRVTIEVPTGGGKTLIGCMLLRCLRCMELSKTRTVIWTVPKGAIFDQTYSALRTEAYQSVLREVCGGSVEVVLLTDHQKLLVCNESHIIVLASKQSMDYRAGDVPLISHRKSPTLKKSVMQFLAEKEPIVIIDEAHLNCTERVAENLVRLRASFVVGLTASPTRNSLLPNNVLVKIYPQQLRDEEMLKMPINVTRLRDSDWRGAVTQAMQKRDELRAIASRAAVELGATSSIHPIVLIQINNDNKISSHAFEEGDVQDPDQNDISSFLCHLKGESFKDRIHIALSGTPDIDLDRSSGKIVCIITKTKLQEGWDCPSAYILCSLRRVQSCVAVQQTLGRVLRMPNTKYFPDSFSDLNQSYVYYTATNFHRAMNSIMECLKKIGYADGSGRRSLFQLSEPMPPLILKLRESFSPDHLGEADRKQISEYQAGSDGGAGPGKFLVISHPLSPAGSKILSRHLGKDEKNALKEYDSYAPRVSCPRRTSPTHIMKLTQDQYESLGEEELAFHNTSFVRSIGNNEYLLATSADAEVLRNSRAEFLTEVISVDDGLPGWGEGADTTSSSALRVPLLSIKTAQGYFVPVDGEYLAAYFVERPSQWNDIGTLSLRLEEQEVTGRIDLQTHMLVQNEGRVFRRPHTDTQNGIEHIMWDALVQWLASDITDGRLDPSNLIDFVQWSLQELGAREEATSRLLMHRYCISEILHKVIEVNRLKDMEQFFQENIYDGTAPVETLFEHCYIFEPGDEYYPWSRNLSSHTFRRHLYSTVADLHPGGIEERVALYLDSHQRVNRWVRNQVNKKSASYSFVVPKGKSPSGARNNAFYPDFVVELSNDKILIIEVKGKQLDGNRIEQNKKSVGEFWQARSLDNMCFFLWLVYEDRSQNIEEEINQSIDAAMTIQSG